MKGSQTQKTLKSNGKGLEKTNTLGNLKKKFDPTKDEWLAQQEPEFFDMSLNFYKLMLVDS
jgi:hypothetical protein